MGNGNKKGIDNITHNPTKMNKFNEMFMSVLLLA